MTNMHPASADTNTNQVSKNAAANMKTRITCAVCSGLGFKWNGFVNEPCGTCNGKGYPEA